MNNEDRKNGQNSENILQNVGRIARRVTLSESEKNLIFKNVDAFVRDNPVQTTNPARPTKINRPSPYFSIFSFQYRHAFSFALIIFVVFGGGTSYAAADALPGDILYSVKVGLNEKIVPLFLSDIKKATYSARLVGERLQEVASLASEGRLDDQKVAIIEEQFEKQESKAETSAEFAAEFEEVLKENESALHILVEKKRESTAALVANLPPEISDSKSIETDMISSGPAVFGIATSEPEPAPVEISTKKAAPADERSFTVSNVAATSMDMSASSTPANLLKKGDDALGIKNYREAYKLYREAYDGANKAATNLKTEKVDTNLDVLPK